MTRYKIMLINFMLLCGCADTPYTTGGTDGLHCPGPQCPCPCEKPLVCTPANTCGLLCGDNAAAADETSTPVDMNECSGIQGETCLAGMCGVVCTVGGPNDCVAIGMNNADCVTIENTAVCSYKK